MNPFTVLEKHIADVLTQRRQAGPFLIRYAAEEVDGKRCVDGRFAVRDERLLAAYVRGLEGVHRDIRGDVPAQGGEESTGELDIPEEGALIDCYVMAIEAFFPGFPHPFCHWRCEGDTMSPFIVLPNEHLQSDWELEAEVAESVARHEGTHALDFRDAWEGWPDLTTAQRTKELDRLAGEDSLWLLEGHAVSREPPPGAHRPHWLQFARPWVAQPAGALDANPYTAALFSRYLDRKFPLPGHTIHYGATLGSAIRHFGPGRCEWKALGLALGASEANAEANAEAEFLHFLRDSFAMGSLQSPAHEPEIAERFQHRWITEILNLTGDAPVESRWHELTRLGVHYFQVRGSRTEKSNALELIEPAGIGREFHLAVLSESGAPLNDWITAKRLTFSLPESGEVIIAVATMRKRQLGARFKIKLH